MILAKSLIAESGVDSLDENVAQRNQYAAPIRGHR